MRNSADLRGSRRLFLACDFVGKVSLIFAFLCNSKYREGVKKSRILFTIWLTFIKHNPEERNRKRTDAVSRHNDAPRKSPTLRAV